MFIIQKDAQRISLVYFVAGVLWILLTDFTVQILSESSFRVNSIWLMQTLKGLLFVCITTIVLYLLLSRAFHNINLRQGEVMRLFAESPIAMWIYEPNTLKILDVNTSTLNLYGYSKSELISKTIYDLHPAGDKITHKKEITSDSFTESSPFINRHTFADGSIHFIQTVITTTKFNGQSARFALLIDITEKYKAEKTREDILRSIGDGFIAVDQNLRITYMNETSKRMLHSYISNPVNTLLDCFPEEAFLRIRDHINESTHSIDKGQLTLNINDGEQIFQMSIYPAEHGFSLYFQDTTLIQKSLKSLRENDQNLEALINSSTDNIWLINKNYELLIANQTFLENYQKVIGKSLSVKSNLAQLTDKKRWADWQLYYERAFNGETFHAEIIDKDLTGNDLITELSIYPIVDEDGRISRVGCFGKNITERVNFERQISRHNARLQDIAWLQSHALRAPLSNIMGLAELLKSSSRTDEDFDRYLLMLEKASKDLDGVIHTIVDKTRAAEGE